MSTETGFGPLQQAIKLALDDDFRAARRAYYDWVREFFAPLQGRDGTQPVDPASLELAREKLNDLLGKERAVVKRHPIAKRWRRVTEAFTVIGLGAAGVDAVLAGGNLVWSRRGLRWDPGMGNRPTGTAAIRSTAAHGRFNVRYH